MGHNTAVDQGYDLEPSPIKNLSGEDSGGKGSYQQSKKTIHFEQENGKQTNLLKKVKERSLKIMLAGKSQASSESAAKSDSKLKKSTCYG